MNLTPVDQVWVSTTIKILREDFPPKFQQSTVKGRIWHQLNIEHYLVARKLSDQLAFNKEMVKIMAVSMLRSLHNDCIESTPIPLVTPILVQVYNSVHRCEKLYVASSVDIRLC